MRKSGLILVVPCYNEAKRIPLLVFEDFLARHEEIFVCFVDDGSQDATNEILGSRPRRAHPRSVDSHRRWVCKPKTYAADRHAKSGAALRLSPHSKMADFGVRRQAVFRATPLSSKRGASEQI